MSVVATTPRPPHPTPPDVLQAYVTSAVASYDRHVADGYSPGDAYAIVVGARAPFEEDDVVAAVVRAVTARHQAMLRVSRAVEGQR
jgi:hypothetical protein